MYRLEVLKETALGELAEEIAAVRSLPSAARNENSTAQTSVFPSRPVKFIKLCSDARIRRTEKAGDDYLENKVISSLD